MSLAQNHKDYDLEQGASLDRAMSRASAAQGFAAKGGAIMPSAASPCTADLRTVLYMYAAKCKLFLENFVDPYAETAEPKYSKILVRALARPGRTVRPRYINADAAASEQWL